MERIYTIPVNEAFEASAADASLGCPFCHLYNKLEQDELGLILGAVQHLTGLPLIPNLTPLKDAMETVCSIGIVLLGCLPLSELLRRALEKPIRWLGGKTGLDSRAATAMLMGFIIAMPAISMLKDLDRRGRIVNGAVLVCSASALSAHLAFTLGVSPDFVPALLLSKLAGSLAAAAAAISITKRQNKMS